MRVRKTSWFGLKYQFQSPRSPPVKDSWFRWLQNQLETSEGLLKNTRLSDLSGENQHIHILNRSVIIQTFHHHHHHCNWFWMNPLSQDIHIFGQNKQLLLLHFQLQIIQLPVHSLVHRVKQTHTHTHTHTHPSNHLLLPFYQKRPDQFHFKIQTLTWYLVSIS